MAKITDKIAALADDASYFSLEFFPPKTSEGFSNLAARLERMAYSLRPLFVNVTWAAGGSSAHKSLELADLCQKQLGLTTCLHLTCTNMSRRLVDDALEKAKSLGIRNILALRGDPPRSEEYREETNGEAEHDDSNEDFQWAVDLVRYIRKQYGDFFCIGVAAYPEGHSDESHPAHQDVDHDLPYLIEKTEAGADFIITQLFFDTEAYKKFESKLRAIPTFQTIPIIPGLMPIQSYQILRRTTTLSHASFPPAMLARLQAVHGDDSAVKDVGVAILCEIVEELRSFRGHTKQGFHFFNLNLEKVVSQIVERCSLLERSDFEVVDDAIPIPSDRESMTRRRLSSINSAPRNRVVVEKTSASSKPFEAPESEAGVPSDVLTTRATTLAISEGEGDLGRAATWDDFPNGRWGDTRSPAYGEIDGYGVSLHVSRPEALQMWKYPTCRDDITDIFRRHLSGELERIPWSEDALNEETATIREELLKLNSKGWWTLASQPAVFGLRSNDAVFGWGPRNGFVFQKAFVELFLPSKDWEILRDKLDNTSDVDYFAGNDSKHFVSSFPDADASHTVTWGTFPAKEIISPTIIGTVSFRAWMDEAFSKWTEWQRLYPPKSATSVFLETARKDCWLVNIVHHSLRDQEALWNFLLQ